MWCPPVSTESTRLRIAQRPSDVLIRAVAMGEHRALTFLSAAWRFRELKALLASTNRTASHSLSLKARFMACIAASVPAFWPAQSWREPAASWMSPPVIERIAFAIILLTTYKYQLGVLLDFLSRAIRRHDNRGARLSGSTKILQRRFVSRASEWHRSSEAALKEEHSLRQPCASIPDGPAAPLVRNAARQMVLP